MQLLIILLAILALVGTPFAATPFEEGVAACGLQGYAKAWRILKPLADAGNADAQFIIAEMYAGGQGVAKDEQEAIKWVFKAAENGNLKAQDTLAFWAMREFRQKRQAVENKAQKIKWITGAAERGNAEAMNMLGMLHSVGNGVPLTTIEAEKWYCRAIKYGHQAAAHNLGLLMAGTIYYLERVKKVGEPLDPPCSKVK